MTEAKKPTQRKVKVAANYKRNGTLKGESITLWGCKFEYDGDQFVANVCPKLCDSLIAAEKIKKIK